MPNLTLIVTDAQAARIKAALTARYKGMPLETATLSAQAQDFIFAMLKDMVQGYERASAAKQAEASLTEL